MSRSLIAGLLLMTGAGLLAWLPLRAVAARPAGPVPKTIILGFDGMDHALTTRWMEAGDLPNFKRLAEMGLFQRLETTNPAQSPVSWAVFNTGCNPGKTGVAGFVGRFFERDKDGKVRMQPEYDTQGRLTFDPVPWPKSMLGDPTQVDAKDFVTFPFALENRAFFILGAAVAGLLAGLLVFKLLLRLPLPAALVIGLGAAALGFWWARNYADALPRNGKLPYLVNPMQGKTFWSFLDERGIRLRGVQVASTYPPDHEGPNTQLLSGLGVPDITGSPGSWTVYTNSQWLFGDKDTPTSGLVRKVFEDTPGTLQDELFGPVNWIKSVELADRIAELEKLRKESGLSTAELDRVSQELDAVKTESKTFHASGRQNDRTKVPFTMKLDKQAHTVDFDVAGTQFRVAQGEWSPFVPVTFELNSMFKAHGLAVFHVVRCDDEEVRVFVPPINIDPKDTPAQLPISAPPGFAAELEQEAGHAYETLGWACITNPLKDQLDSKIPEQSFMDDMASTEQLREDLLMASLTRPDDWDVYFQVFSTPDRVCHMLFREFDPEHPKYDAALANTQVHAFGQAFPLKDAIRQVYMSEDRMLGKVLDELAAGRFGDDALLLVVSDHGFSSFRRQVNLNNVLHDLGFLQFKFKTDESGKPLAERYTLEELFAGPASQHDMLRYVDWTATRAYSLGLGEVFINLKGREPKGIVEPAQYDEVVEAVRTGLLSLTDPKDGTKYVTSASRRDKLYNGPWWHEGTAKRKTVGGREEEVGHDGFGDIFLGYAPHYRVSWGNTMGGLDEATVTDNDNHWSGDHVSVDPSHVPGVLFSNRKLPAGTAAGLIDVAPTILTRYGIDPAPPHTEMDGTVLPFEHLTR